MWNTIKIIEKTKPKYVIWENVKNVLSKTHIHNFTRYLDKLNNLGYVNYWKVLNAKDYGIPQNRERIYVVSIRVDIDLKKTTFIFPEKEELTLRLKDFLETNVKDKYYLDKELIKNFNYYNSNNNTNIIRLFENGQMAGFYEKNL